MKRAAHSPAPIRKSRARLTLPADLLSTAQRIARRRKVNLSTVIAEALSDGLRVQTATERSEAVLDSYRKAFSGFSETEMAILNGVILEPATRR